MDSESLDKAIVKMISTDSVEVPPYPKIASQLSRLNLSGDFDFEDLATIVCRDQTLKETVLHHTNALRFGNRIPVTTLQQAMLRIGTEELCRIAWAASIGTAVRTTGPLLELKELVWRQSVTCAFLCAELAKSRNLDGYEAFMAGLVHRLGRSLALTCLERVLERFGGNVLPQNQWFYLVDRYEIELGIVLSAHWELPDRIAEVIARHDAPELASSAPELTELAAASSEVVALLDENTSLDVELLSTTKYLGGRRELDQVALFIPKIPNLVYSLLASPLREPDEYRNSPVEYPGTSLTGPSVDFTFTLYSVEDSREMSYRAVALYSDGLVLRSPHPLRENGLIRLELRDEHAPFEVWATVLLCAEHAGEYRIEVRFFCMSGEQVERWTTMVRKARIEAAARRSRTPPPYAK